MKSSVLYYIKYKSGYDVSWMRDAVYVKLIIAY